ncbi:phage tail tape measure protein [Deinococcus budaensis]|uniref:Murein DD-endopeptidase MepM/ murein hydrolase activator NlpD n=1 Tax=Deinococcus budaensis TaxID=1665626 RepID=A0A7W8GF90_9DEIO|nr:phage tail tape measure protein [Deinococcus budaensis]MBB5234480.1 murein DD-endopeptidase MepM/ murein hydrolase activator NlpD [Deinococcus budaensis]
MTQSSKRTVVYNLRPNVTGIPGLKRFEESLERILGVQTKLQQQGDVVRGLRDQTAAVVAAAQQEAQANRAVDQQARQSRQQRRAEERAAIAQKKADDNSYQQWWKQQLREQEQSERRAHQEGVQRLRDRAATAALNARLSSQAEKLAQQELRATIRELDNEQKSLRAVWQIGKLVGPDLVQMQRDVQRRALEAASALDKQSDAYRRLMGVAAASQRTQDQATGRITPGSLSHGVVNGIQQSGLFTQLAAASGVGAAAQNLGLVASNFALAKNNALQFAGASNTAATAAGFMSAAGAGLAVGLGAVGVGFVSLGKVGLEQTKILERGLNTLQASGVQDLEGFQTQVKALKEDLGTVGKSLSLATLTASAAELVKANLSAGDSLTVLAASSKLAAAENTNLNDTSAQLLMNTRQYGLEVSESARVADMFAKAGNLAAGTANDLSLGFGKVGGTGLQAGIEMNDLLGMLVELDLKGMRAADVGADALRTALSSLSDVTEKGQGILRELGVEIDDASGKARPAGDVMADLGEKMRGMGITVNKNTGELEGNGEALRTVAGLMDTRAAAAVINLTGEWRTHGQTIKDSEEYATEYANTMSQGVEPAQKRLKTAFEDTGLALAKSFAGPLADFLDQVLSPAVTRLGEFFTKLTDIKNLGEILVKVRLEAGDDGTTQVLKLLTAPVTIPLGLGAQAGQLLNVDQLQQALIKGGILEQQRTPWAILAQFKEVANNYEKYLKMAYEADARWKDAQSSNPLVTGPSVTLNRIPENTLTGAGPLSPGQTRALDGAVSGLVGALGLAGREILNEFGVSGKDYHHDGAVRADAVHNGIDLGAPRGTAILSPFAGALSVREDTKNGKVFELLDAAGNKLVGIHLDQFDAEVLKALRAGGGKALILKGQRIGTVGNTGTTAGSAPHLHLMGYAAGSSTPIDPRTIPFVGGAPASAARPTSPAPTPAATPSPEDVRKSVQARIDDILARVDLKLITAPAAIKQIAQIRDEAEQTARSMQQKGTKGWQDYAASMKAAQGVIDGLKKGTGGAKDVLGALSTQFEYAGKTGLPAYINGLRAYIAQQDKAAQSTKNTQDRLDAMANVNRARQMLEDATKPRKGPVSVSDADMAKFRKGAEEVIRLEKGLETSTNVDWRRRAANRIAAYNAQGEAAQGVLAVLQGTAKTEAQLADESTRREQARASALRTISQGVQKGKEDDFKRALASLKASQAEELAQEGLTAAQREQIVRRTGPAILRATYALNASIKKGKEDEAEAWRTSEQAKALTASEVNAEVKRLRDAARTEERTNNQTAQREQASAARLAGRTRVQEERQLAAELAGLRTKAAQATADRLKSIEDGQIARAQGNAQRQLDLTREFSQAQFNRQQAILLAEKKQAYANAAGKPNQGALEAAADADFLRDLETARQARLSAVRSAQKAVEQEEEGARQRRLAREKIVNQRLAEGAEAARQANIEDARLAQSEIEALRDQDLLNAKGNVTEQVRLQRYYAEQVRLARRAVADAIYADRARDLDNEYANRPDDPMKARLLGQAGAARQQAYDAADRDAGNQVNAALDTQTEKVRELRSQYSQLADSIRDKVKAGSFDEEAQEAAATAFDQLAVSAGAAGVAGNSYLAVARQSVQAALDAGRAAETQRLALADLDREQEDFIARQDAAADSAIELADSLVEAGSTTDGLMLLTTTLDELMAAAGEGPISGEAVSKLAAAMERLNLAASKTNLNDAAAWLAAFKGVGDTVAAAESSFTQGGAEATAQQGQNDQIGSLFQGGAGNVARFLLGTDGQGFAEAFWFDFSEASQGAFMQGLGQLDTEALAGLGTDMLQRLLDGMGDDAAWDSWRAQVQGAMTRALELKSTDAGYADLGAVLDQFEALDSRAEGYSATLSDRLLPELERIRDAATDPALKDMAEKAIGYLNGEVEAARELVSVLGQVKLSQLDRLKASGGIGEQAYIDQRHVLLVEQENARYRLDIQGKTGKALELAEAQHQINLGNIVADGMQATQQLTWRIQDETRQVIRESEQADLEYRRSTGLIGERAYIDARHQQQVQAARDEFNVRVRTLQAGEPAYVAAELALQVKLGQITRQGMTDQQALTDRLEAQARQRRQQEAVADLDHRRSLGLVGERAYLEERQRLAEAAAREEFAARVAKMEEGGDEYRDAEAQLQADLTAITRQGVLDRIALEQQQLQAFIGGLDQLGGALESAGAGWGVFLKFAGQGIDLFGKFQANLKDLRSAFNGGSLFDKLGAVGGTLGLVATGINLVGQLGDAILNLSPGFRAWKTNLLEVAEAQKKALSIDAGGFNSPWAKALEQDAANREKLANAGFWKRVWWGLTGSAPQVMKTESAKLMAELQTIFANLGSGLSNIFQSSMSDAFLKGDMTSWAQNWSKTFDQQVGQLILKTMVDAALKEGAVAADLAELTKAIQEQRYNDIPAIIERIRANAGAAMSPIVSVAPSLPGFGSGKDTSSGTGTSDPASNRQQDELWYQYEHETDPVKKAALRKQLQGGSSGTSGGSTVTITREAVQPDWAALTVSITRLADRADLEIQAANLQMEAARLQREAAGINAQAAGMILIAAERLSGGTSSPTRAVF